MPVFSLLPGYPFAIQRSVITAETLNGDMYIIFSGKSFSNAAALFAVGIKLKEGRRFSD